MKWFQFDSDTPNDPKIKALIRVHLVAGGEDGAAAVFGRLVLLWAYVANHGHGKPGEGLTSEGEALPLDEMADECLIPTPNDMVGFLDVLAGRGLIDRARWEQDRVVFLPAMAKRAEAYARSKGRGTTGEPGGTPAPTKPTKGKAGGKRGKKAPDQPLHTSTSTNSTDHSQDVSAGTAGPLLPDDEAADQVKALVQLWNTERKPVPLVQEITPQRRAAYTRALKAKPDLQDWRKAILWANSQAWCNAPGRGDHPNWRMDLDWMAKPGNLPKMLDRVAADQKHGPAANGRDTTRGTTGTERGQFMAAVNDGDQDDAAAQPPQ